MRRLVLTINTIENTQKLLHFIEQFNFIETIEIANPVKLKRKEKQKTINKQKDIPKSKFKSWEEFEGLCGIWASREITKESLRKTTWRVC